MHANCETILQVLKQAADAHQHKLKALVIEKLDDRERQVLGWLFKQYKDEDKRRWYDPCHVLFSTDFALALIEEEGCARSIVTAIMLHDIGYFAIEDKTQWSNPNSRIVHMQEGAALAARVLCENGFAATEIEEIVGMIAVHDNPYIRIPIRGNVRLEMRDCDRVWVMHALSFYKDWASKHKAYKHPRDFLHDRMIQFYGWEHPFGKDEWRVDVDIVKKNAARIETPARPLTRKVVQRQFEQRIEELRDGGLLNNVNTFRTYLASQIDREPFWET
jgi:hypothetical protein